jgi:hypothetical protein
MADRVTRPSENGQGADRLVLAPGADRHEIIVCGDSDGQRQD